MDFLSLAASRHIAAILLLAAFVYLTWRWMWSRSRVIAWITAGAVAGRVLLGMTLFLVSLYQLPIARSLQMPEGFWEPTYDAHRYYVEAIKAIDTGIFSVDLTQAPSPFYIRTLAVWMWLVGVTPAAGLFLNALCYLALTALFVAIYMPENDWKRDLPCVAAVATVSFSPALVVHSTQPLKDDLFSLLVAVVFACMLPILQRLVYARKAACSQWQLSLIVALAFAGTFAIGEVRWYFNAIIIGALAMALAVFAVKGRTARLTPFLTGSAALLAGLLLVSGNVPTIEQRLQRLNAAKPDRLATGIAWLPFDFARLTQKARDGYIASGGNTNLVSSAASAGGTAGASRSFWTEFIAPIQAGALGVATVFVPISLLHGLSLVDFNGNGLLMTVAEFDTVFQSLMIVLMLVVAWQRRRLIGDRLPFVVFGGILAGSTAVLMGYVVTNYGTLFRLRPMIVVPACVLAAALPHRRSGRLQPSHLQQPAERQSELLFV